MAKKKASGQTPATRAAQAAGPEYRVVTVAHTDELDGGYALDTSRVLGRDPATIFKTLMAEVDGSPVCAVVPANAMLNLKALARAAGGKRARMMPPSSAERLTGYVTGGISPLGQRTASPVFIDDSAQDLTSVLISGGRRSLSLDVDPRELARALSARFADLADVGRHT
ncbi:MAG: aminoacyl-tRNA deacylase [Actinomycetaceae bacterium]|nr:aminoacyl-tRNA deacylase [Actinomycetaceae bacterium]